MREVKVLKGQTSLSHLQIDVIEAVAPCLSFVEALTGGKISVYAPNISGKGYVSLYGEELKEFETRHEYALVEDSFRTGKVFNHWEESETGGSGIRSFCVKDGNDTIAVIALVYSLLMPMSEFTHLLHAADLCVSYGRKLNPAVWGSLEKGDGVIIADKFHRVIFVDDAARLIYRSLNVGNLLGRNLFDEDLKQSVIRETYSKKSPWEREMTTKDSVLREKRLDFNDGGKTKGHIVIISDITKEKKREEDERVQAALRERIAELENELSSIKDSLAARKLIDRAKGYLMDTKNLTEEESYRRIQRLAMMNRMTIKEVAERILKEKK